MNPFRISPTPLKEQDIARWVCVKSSWDKLYEAYCNHTNTILQGVEGSGKTTLLNLFFSSDFCQKAAREKKLVFRADLSDCQGGLQLCSYLTRKLLQSARIYLPDAEVAALAAVVEDLRAAGVPDKMQFVEACEHLSRQKYTLFLVMDRFEAFVSDPDINQDHHDTLRGLLDKHIMCCIVATNYDLEKTSLPPDTHGSMYLQKLQNKITLNGFTLENAKEFVAKYMGSDDTVELTPKRIEFLHYLTGGIPLLFETAAHCMYERLATDGSVKVGEIIADLQDKTRVLHSNWCKFFTENYIEALQSILATDMKEGELKKFAFSHTNERLCDAATRLCERGFFVKVPREENCYTFNSLHLQRLVMKGALPLPAKKQAEQPVKTQMTKPYNIFISYKRTVDGEKPTRDSEIALELYEAFSRIPGFVPFLDVKEIPHGIGASDFRETINRALECVTSFVFVCTCGDYLETEFVKEECTDYYGELQRGRKPKGSVYGVLEGVTDSDLPMNLRHRVEHFRYGKEELQRLILYIQNQMRRDSGN